MTIHITWMGFFATIGVAAVVAFALTVVYAIVVLCRWGK